METFAGRIISFCQDLDFNGPLPEGIRVMNTFRDQTVMNGVKSFYSKYYSEIMSAT